MIRQKKKKNAEEHPCRSRRFCRVSHTSVYDRTSVFRIRQKKKQQTNKHQHKQTKQKQNIPATLKGGGDDFRRC